MDEQYIEDVLNYALKIIKKNPEIKKQELRKILILEFGKRSEKIVNTVLKTVYNEKQVSINKATNVIRKVRNKIKKWGDDNIPAPIKPVYARLLVILDILADIIDGTYKAHAAAIAAMVSALIYLLFPFDLIPDFLPGPGFIDDAGVIVLVFYTLENIIKSYCKAKNIDMDALNKGEYRKLDE